MKHKILTAIFLILLIVSCKNKTMNPSSSSDNNNDNNDNNTKPPIENPIKSTVINITLGEKVDSATINTKLDNSFNETGKYEIEIIGDMTDNDLQALNSALKAKFTSPSIKLSLKLKEANIPNNTITSSFGEGYLSSIEKLILPDSVSTIENDSLSLLPNLTELELPENLNIVGNNVFKDISKLTSLNMKNQILEIGDNSFCELSSLTSINISDSLKIVGRYSLSGAKNIKTITLPYYLSYIKEYAFSDWTSLTEVIFNENTSIIESYAFNNCTSLKIINFEKASALFKYVFVNAFSGINGLDKLYIHSYAQVKIDDNVFNNVKNIIVKETSSTTVSLIIGGDLSSSKIYFPDIRDGSMYQDYERWKGFLRKSGEVWREDQILYNQTI